MYRMSAARANLLVFAAVVGFTLVIGLVTQAFVQNARQAREWVQHSELVLRTLGDLGIAVRDAETGQRGYLLTSDPQYLAPYQSALGRIPGLEANFGALIADDPKDVADLHALVRLIRLKLDELGLTVRLAHDGMIGQALVIVRGNSGFEYMRGIETVLDRIGAHQRGVLRARLRDVQERSDQSRILILFGTISSLAALAIAALMLNRGWSRSRRAEDEQRHSLAMLQDTLDGIGQGAALFDRDRRLVHWNACLIDLLGLPAGAGRAGVAFDELIDRVAEGRTLVSDPRADLERALATGEAVVTERVLSNGTRLETRFNVMTDGGFVVTVCDMTHRAEAERVIRESQKMHALGQLTGGIAHDFNNLLTVILGNLEMARTRIEAASPLLLRIERAVEAARRGSTLTSQLLAFARRQPLEPAPFDLAVTLPRLIPLLTRTLGEQIEIDLREARGLWPAMADAAMLEGAVLNLAINARDAMPSGGRLTIELGNAVLEAADLKGQVEAVPGDYVMVAVSDTGTGMTHEVMARVFEPFFTTKPDGRGTGLGLASVSGFIRQSHGHIRLSSEPGRGTTVRLYLPRAPESEWVVAAPATVQRGDVAPSRPAATILVIEDEPAVREIVVSVLSELGHTVIEAAAGDEALRVFGAHSGPIDALLTDVMLAGRLGGRDVSDRLTAIRPGLRTLYMSGHTASAVARDGRLEDGLHFLGKPFSREQLIAAVNALLMDHPPIDHAAAGSDPTDPEPPLDRPVVPPAGGAGRASQPDARMPASVRS